MKPKIVSFCIVAALAAASCEEHRAARPAPPADSAATARRADTPAAPHGPQRKQLRELMKRISAETQEQWPQDIPRAWDDPDAARLVAAIDHAERLAASLVTGAEAIPDSVRHVEMTQTDRADIQAEAANLRAHALELAAAARARQPEEMQRRLDAISATCIACHTRFRDFAGELDVQRVRSAGDDDRVASAATQAVGRSRL